MKLNDSTSPWRKCIGNKFSVWRMGRWAALVFTHGVSFVIEGGLIEKSQTEALCFFLLQITRQTETSIGSFISLPPGCVVVSVVDWDVCHQLVMPMCTQVSLGCLVFLPALCGDLWQSTFPGWVVEAGGVSSCQRSVSRLFGALAWLLKAPVLYGYIQLLILCARSVMRMIFWSQCPLPWSPMSLSSITVFSVFFPWGVWGNESHRLPVIEGASFISCSGGVHPRVLLFIHLFRKIQEKLNLDGALYFYINAWGLLTKSGQHLKRQHRQICFISETWHKQIIIIIKKI